MQLLSAKLLQAVLDLSHSFPDGPEGEVGVHRHSGYEAVVGGGAEVVEVLMEGKRSKCRDEDEHTINKTYLRNKQSWPNVFFRMGRDFKAEIAQL